MSINLKKVPNTPGVYKFFNNHEIIYIGKAKNLKKRVSSYFGKSYKDRKTSQIKFLTDKIETFTTKNEVEALLLEQMLIKENKPKFNILLRDDKTYPYIYFSLDHNFPGVYLKRTKNNVDKKYFGPFVSSEAVKKSIKEIQKIFKVRNCSDNTFANRTRPCIEFQMKRCSAPCTKNISKEAFDKLGQAFTEIQNNYAQDAQLDLDKERQLLGKNANEIINSNVEWGRGLVAKGIFTEADYEELEILGGTAKGQRIIQKIRGLTGEKEIPVASIEGEAPDQEELMMMVQDARYQNDPTYRKKVEKMYQEAYSNS